MNSIRWILYMNLIRWILFIPIAFLASLIASTLSNWITTAFFGSWVGSTTCGGMGALSFIYVGIKIAPKRSRTVQLILCYTALFLGLLATVSAVVMDDPTGGLEGIAMLIVAVGCMKINVYEILDEEENLKEKQWKRKS